MNSRSSRRLITVVLLVVCILVINAVISIAGSPSHVVAAQSQVGTLLFHRCIESDCDIYTMNSDGSNQEFFYGSDKVDAEARLSPDRSKILFSVGTAGTTSKDIYTINVDKTGFQRITSDGSSPYRNSAWWSPDGTKIGFKAWLGQGGAGTPWVMNADGSGIRRLVSGGEAHDVVYGSDGYIYFQSINLQTPTYDIYRVNVDGTGLERVIETDNASEGHPVLSPDGRYLLFTRINAVGTNAQICNTPTPCSWDIWIRDLTTDEEVRLTDSQGAYHNLWPIWSPDASQIAFTSDRDGDREVYIMDVAGDNVQQITFNIVDDSVTDWVEGRLGDAALVAENDNYAATEDLLLTVGAPGILSNDTSLNGTDLFVDNYVQPNNGVLTLERDGSFTYIANADYCGPDSFTYSVSDGQFASDVATVVLDVTCVNDPPVVNIDTLQIMVDEGLPASSSGSFYDVEGDPVTLSASLGTVATESGSGNTTELLVYENDFLDLEGWTSPGIIGNRCNSPIQQRDSVVYNSGGNRSSHVVLPQTIITEEAQPFTVEVKFRYRDDGGMYIGLMKENANPCEAWANNGFVFAIGGERQDAYALIWPEGGSYEILRILKTHDGLWHIARMERDVDGIWSLYIDDELIGTSSVPDFDTNYKYLSVDSYTGSGVNEFDWIKVYTQEEEKRWAWNYTTTDGPHESQTVTVFADDGNGGIGKGTIDLKVNNVAPSAVFSTDGPVDEGSSFTLSLTGASDPSITDTGVGFQYTFDCGSGYGAYSASSSTSCLTDDNGARTVKGRIKDKDDGVSEYTAIVDVHNIAPTIEKIATSVDPVDINDQPVAVTVEFSDPGTADTHEVAWDWGDSSINTQDPATNPAMYSHTYAEPGVYPITVTVTDDDDGYDSETYGFIVIYDPEGGFVTGGGWIYTEAGWCQLDEVCTGAEGKANFGFVSKYKKGATVPTGNTEFNFTAGGLNFHSSSYNWLVVNQGGTNAQYKGSGTVNGKGDYKFMLWAGDKEPDTFRIKIWTETEEGGEDIVYDNGSDQAIDGGNIVVHSGK